ncbi:MAG: prepilin-type N-terminal cleavage/methylation domain-containing protein [Actinomycetota bacterium]|nr:prepilin-type N-terminal cleavage/methylation domain-containing protein [Actinomycetota bacterium]
MSAHFRRCPVDRGAGDSCCPARGQHGFSLVELMVALLLLSLLMGAAYGLLTASQNAAGAAHAGFQGLDSAQVEMNALSTAIRAASQPSPGTPAVLQAGPTTIRLYSASGPQSPQGPQLVTFSLGGSSLSEQVSMPSPPPAAPLTYAASGVSTRNVGGDVSSLALTYYDSSMTQLLPASGTTTLSSSQAASVTFVGIQLTTQAPGGAPVTLADTVLLRNVYYTFGASAGSSG